MKHGFFKRFLILSVILHAGVLIGFQYSGWNPVPVPSPSPKGFQTARARVVLERMKTADPPPVTPTLREDPAATGPAVVDVTDRYVAPIRGGSLAPKNLNEILDKPIAGDTPAREPSREERGGDRPPSRPSESGDLERAWRESAQDLPVTGSAGRGNSRGGGGGGGSSGGKGTIATEGFAVGGRGERGGGGG